MANRLGSDNSESETRVLPRGWISRHLIHANGGLMQKAVLMTKSDWMFIVGLLGSFTGSTKAVELAFAIVDQAELDNAPKLPQ